MPPDDIDTPLIVGARNPFAYAEHKSGQEINWNQMNSGNKRKKLADAFGMEYERIFDPVYGSDLFVQKDVETGDLRPCITVSAPQWAPNPAGSNYTLTSRVYNDPVQGDLPDCYLIAALSSIAFAGVTIPDPILVPD